MKCGEFLKLDSIDGKFYVVTTIGKYEISDAVYEVLCDELDRLEAEIAGCSNEVESLLDELDECRGGRW